MKIARYWAKGEANAYRSDGVPISLSIWRWSDSSEQDAQQRASTAAQEAAHRMESGAAPEGGYGTWITRHERRSSRRSRERMARPLPR